MGTVRMARERTVTVRSKVESEGGGENRPFQCCSCWQRRDVRSRHGYLEPLLRCLRSKHLQPTLLLRDVLDVRSLSVSHSCAAHVVALHTVAQLAKSRTKFTRVSAKNFRGT